MTPLKSTAPSVIGTSSRNEKRAAASRSSPRNRAAEIVIPDRDTPGISARRLREPDGDGGAEPESSIRRRSGVRSATKSTIAKTARRIAICQGSPSRSAMKSSPSAPTSAAGTVATTTSQAILVGVSIAPAAERPSHARVERDDLVPEVRDDGDQRAQVQRDVEGLVEASCSSRYVHSASHGTRMRWPDDEIGRSSVAPGRARARAPASRQRAGSLPHAAAGSRRAAVITPRPRRRRRRGARAHPTRATWLPPKNDKRFCAQIAAKR